MADSTDNENQGRLRQHPVIKYGLYALLFAVLIAEIGFAASAWFSVQTVAGLIGGVVLVGTMSYFSERTTLGQSAEETFQQHRLLTSLFVASLVTVGGIVVSSSIESPSSVFLLAFVLGMIGGMLFLDEIEDHY